MVFDLGLTSFWVSHVIESVSGETTSKVEGMIKNFLDTTDVSFHLIGISGEVISYTLLCKKTKSVCIIHTTITDVKSSSENYLKELNIIHTSPLNEVTDDED